MTSTPNYSLVVLTRAIEKLTPLSLAAPWDNVGVLAQAPYPSSNCKSNVLCCIDLTTEVANEALDNPATSMIVCYHPIIFSGLKRLTLDDPLQTSILRLTARGISIVCIHTAADNAWYGVNDHLAVGTIGKTRETTSARNDDCIRVSPGGTIRAIKVERNPPPGQEGCGTGRMVSLDASVSLETLVASIKARLGLQFLQLARASNGKDLVSSVAICAGSGSGVLKDVMADVYLTGELGHHEILAANARGIHVIVCNHSATERPWLQSFRDRLETQMNIEASNSAVTDEKLGPYTVSVSTADKEPLVVV